MNIAITAHDGKKELMIQFCIAYSGILSHHNLCATGTTAKLVSEATGLKVQGYLSGSQGGDQQISSRIACNEIDMVLYFRDSNYMPGEDKSGDTIIRLCDAHNIPVATNIATAEMLIHGLQRGDLDWRDIVRSPHA
jgi:methylglyoxal synthase